MDNIQPGSAAEFRALGERWGGPDWQRPLSRALVAAGLLSGRYADKTVRRYAADERRVPDDIMAWLRQQPIERDAWATGTTRSGLHFVAHLVAPRFWATYEHAGLRSIDWIDPKPDRRAIGKLMEAAGGLAAQSHGATTATAAPADAHGR